jgi:tRNA (adenine57-N1/adenine58-N1)-methyltransferase
MNKPYQIGDQVLLIDTKRRQYLVTLQEGGEFHTHAGVVFHDELINNPEGTSVLSSSNSMYMSFRPSMSEYIKKMPRGAQVIYPKDIGAIMMIADVYPDAKVFETGIGSGALSMALLRSGANVFGYEIREDFANRAQENVRVMLGEDALKKYNVEIRDSYENVEEEDFDRAILDLPEPWLVVPHLNKALLSGGIVVAYTPSIKQAIKFREAISNNGFSLAETIEVLHRGWHIDGEAVRPDHRMVAHTGFISSGRLLHK